MSCGELFVAAHVEREIFNAYNAFEVGHLVVVELHAVGVAGK